MRRKILRTICMLVSLAIIIVCVNSHKDDTLRAAVYSNQTEGRGNTEGFLIGDVESYNPTKEYHKGDVVQSKGRLYTCKKELSLGVDVGKSDTWEKTSLLGLVKSITTDFKELSTTMEHIDATAGGGCYYTCFTTKPYLNGYKIRLTDHTTAKSCPVLFNEDSNYYAGTVTVPLNDEIEVELWYEGKLQGTMQTNCTTTSGYATINLDALIDANFSDLLKVNDHLALNICRDSHFTENRALFPEIIELVYLNDQALDECMNSIDGLSIETKTFEELYEKPETLIQILHHDVADLFLANESIANDIANSHLLLSAISKDARSIAQVEGSEQMHHAFDHSSLAKTQTMVGGDPQQVTGNLILISLESGTLGNCYEYGTRRYSGTYETATMINCKGYISQRPNCFYTINYTENKCIAELVQSGYSATYTYGIKNFYVSERESATSANQVLAPYKFVQAARVESMSPKTLTNVRGYWDNTDTLTATEPTAASKITYINLDDPQS